MQWPHDQLTSCQAKKQIRGFVQSRSSHLKATTVQSQTVEVFSQEHRCLTARNMPQTMQSRDLQTALKARLARSSDALWRATHWVICSARHLQYNLSSIACGDPSCQLANKGISEICRSGGCDSICRAWSALLVGTVQSRKR